MLPSVGARSRASRRLTSLPLAFALGACATYYEDPRPEQAALGGAAGEASVASSAGSNAAGSSAQAGSGGAGSGNVAGAGAGAEMGGIAGAQGGIGGTQGGVAGAAGAAESGGAAAGRGGAGAGGVATAGAGGKASGGGGAGGMAGSGGSGGAATHTCSEHPLTAKTKWLVTASSSDAPAPPAQAVDGDLSTRWTTGKEQVGGEWLQIDFGATVALTQVTLVLGSSVNDYPRKYATRFSNSSQNTAAPVLVSGMGAPSSDTVMNFPKGSSGRYVLISQSGTAPALWWSVAEVLAQCAD